ncbi:PaaI family thioesterase [Paracoccaceae bacterium GXU_MW_L88]
MTETLQQIKARRDTMLARLTDSVPYAAWLGVRFDRRGDELTSILPYDGKLIGNPALPALHGGAVGAFLEITAQVVLSWSILWPKMEGGEEEPALVYPKTIDFTVDYLRSGLPRDAYARAQITRSGRRYASVFIEAWQDNRDRPFAHANAHFLMPQG